MKLQLSNRTIHRDLAYFYLGLILAFSLSGIILNHRQSWYPMEYAYESKEVNLTFENADLSREDIIEATQSLNLEYESHRLRGNNLRVDFQDGAILDVNANTGKGVLEYRRLVPVIGHSILLHKSTDNFWIWYSDIFGLAMIVIAITGAMISSGKNGFKNHGWKLMVVGLIFPLLFLLFG